LPQTLVAELLWFLPVSGMGFCWCLVRQHCPVLLTVSLQSIEGRAYFALRAGLGRWSEGTPKASSDV
jgi:hypothetical protein